MIRSIEMQIRTTQKGFKAFDCKFEPFERDSKHSNAHSNHSKGFRSILMQIRANSKGIGSIRIQIRTIGNGFEAFESKFEPFERDSKHSNANSSQFERDWKHSNSNSNHWKRIPSIRIQIRTIRKGFEGFKCKF